MSRARPKPILTILLLAVAILAAGCAADDKPPVAAPGAGPQPKLLSDLSAVSDVPIDPLHASAAPARGEGLLHSRSAGSTGPVPFEAEPGASRTVGDEGDPGTVRLLNKKAEQFGNFSGVILDHIYAHLMPAERSEEISRTKLPTDLRPVVVTAILDRSGKLTEIILEQHSGVAKIDQMFIAVCKKSIWYNNPPVAALSGNGNYELRIKLKLENYASSDEHHWSFITDLGLGIG